MGPMLARVDPDTDPQPEISEPVHQLMPLRIERFDAANRALSRRCNTFIQRYHYLGYQVTVGANLRYRVMAADGPGARLSGLGIGRLEDRPARYVV